MALSVVRLTRYDAGMENVCRLKTITPQRLLAIRTLTSQAALGGTIESSLEAVWAYLNRQVSATVGPAIVVYHRCDEDMLDIDVGFPVAEPIDGLDRVQPIDLPGGRAATMLHVGPYEALPQTHAALEAWMRTQGHSPAGPRFEVYWVDPGQAADPKELRTEVVYPIHDPAASA